MKFQRSRLTDLPLCVLQVAWEQQGRWCTVSVPSIKGKPDSRSCWWGVASSLRASLWSPSFLGSSPQLWNPGNEELGAPLLGITPHLHQPMDWFYLSGWDGNYVSSLVVILCNAQHYLLLFNNGYILQQQKYNPLTPSSEHIFSFFALYIFVTMVLRSNAASIFPICWIPRCQ